MAAQRSKGGMMASMVVALLVINTMSSSCSSSSSCLLPAPSLVSSPSSSLSSSCSTRSHGCPCWLHRHQISSGSMLPVIRMRGGWNIQEFLPRLKTDEERSGEIMTGDEKLVDDLTSIKRKELPPDVGETQKLDKSVKADNDASITKDTAPAKSSSTQQKNVVSSSSVFDFRNPVPSEEELERMQSENDRLERFLQEKKRNIELRKAIQALAEDAVNEGNSTMPASADPVAWFQQTLKQKLGGMQQDSGQN
ncbi:hypothetical protein GUITHDRAFT_148219 [Guillardia theta CCMP2712]|uniref:Uncharacterized protein n=2 Tax=Guillardia theta TaxID=55529 RepID=L1IAS2_GUITC|nr:hypothetical protein GUITHDRAFT_148219 [Guillardia theta CCMP2712]EKX33019.1 hypothetical protein GUITHDRAFT_148219 [Guillardia theta CCMP2712]|eukprot:XP_005819999.1 hypothetical protein GUITHDRAFT_148219 [Guillardia theta CCMP2712]